MDDVLNLFSILSDKTRLRILLLLFEKELCVCEIFAALKMSQPRVSRQLAILKQSKLIKDRREGKWIYYKIETNSTTEHLQSLLSMLIEWIKDDTEFNLDKKMLLGLSDLKKCITNCD